MVNAGRLEPLVTVTDAPDPQEEDAIRVGLGRFNEEQTGIRDSRPLAVVVRDPETKQPLGGLTGRTSLGLLFIDLFFLPHDLRGGGLGSRLLRLAEDEARSAAASRQSCTRSTSRRPASMSATATVYWAPSTAFRPAPAASS